MNRLVLIYNVEKSTLFNCPLTYCIVNHMSTKTCILFWKFTFRQVCMQAILIKSFKKNSKFWMWFSSIFPVITLSFKIIEYLEHSVEVNWWFFANFAATWIILPRNKQTISDSYVSLFKDFKQPSHTVL